MPSLDLDWRLRLAAFAALGRLRDAGGGLVRLADLERGFEFEGERIPFINARRGIWRPRQLGAHGAALTIVTTPPKRGKEPPYDDQATRPIVSEEEFLGAAPLRAFATRNVKERLHRRRFRKLVVSAYRERCAVCRLHHPELLDAAHILPDRDERGRPEVPNGLSLCRIHHGAFDERILGVAPDYRIHIRRDVLDEHDGPMLQHGLKEMEGQRIVVPAREPLRPNPDYLAERFEEFRAA